MKTLYIEAAPKTIPCWYCGQPCSRWHQDQRLYPNLDYSTADRWEYHCNRHEGLDVEVTCVRNRKEENSWFFNRISITHSSLRLYWNFYAGDWIHLEEYKPGVPGKSGGEWKFVSLREWPPKWKVYPIEFINQSPERLLSFFKLYKVFS